MTVLSVTPQKKHLTRVDTSDGKFFLLDSELCAELCLREGTVLDGEMIEEILKRSDYERAKSRALWYLDRGSLSCRSLAEKLRRAGFSKEAIDRVLERFCELSLLDDNAYALRLCERCAEAGMSRRAAQQKLYEKGVPREIALSALDGVEFDDGEAIQTVIAKKYASKLQKGETEKVYAALLRRGFSYSDVKQALKEYIDN